MSDASELKSLFEAMYGKIRLQPPYGSPVEKLLAEVEQLKESIHVLHVEADSRVDRMLEGVVQSRSDGISEGMERAAVMMGEFWGEIGEGSADYIAAAIRKEIK